MPPAASILSTAGLVLTALTCLAPSIHAQGDPGTGGKSSPAPGVVVAPSDPLIRFTGRWEHTGAGGPTAAWSGCGVEFCVRDAVAVNALLRGRTGVSFEARVDGKKLGAPITLEDGRANYRLADDLDLTRPHRIELRKRTEPLFGDVQFLGLELAGGGGRLVSLPPAPERRIEFIGDSITCGYGVEAASEHEHFSAQTEDFNATYAALAADELQAQPVAVAWSGSCLSEKIAAQLGWAKCLPPLYPLTLPERGETRWDFARWTPDAVVINLGTNDFSANPPPAPAAWTVECAGFLAAVREHYPRAMIFCVTGPMLDPASLQALGDNVRAALENRRAAGDTRVRMVEFDPQDAGRDGLGADYHPSRATHRRMAAKLVESIRPALGW